MQPFVPVPSGNNGLCAHVLSRRMAEGRYPSNPSMTSTSPQYSREKVMLRDKMRQKYCFICGRSCSSESNFVFTLQDTNIDKSVLLYQQLDLPGVTLMASQVPS